MSEKSAPAQGALTFIGSCVSVLTIIIAFVIALTYLGVNMNIIVGTMSAVGLGISLSLKDNMANVAGGIQILLTKPFKVNDYIVVENQEGFVTRIEMMFTVVQALDGSEIIIPNAQAVSETVINITHNKVRAIRISFDIAVTEDFNRVKEICLKAANECQYVLKDKDTEVYIDKIATGKYTIVIYAWCKIAEYWNGYYDLNERIQKYRLEQGILSPAQPITIR